MAELGLQELYQRNINVSVERPDPQHILVQASLLDLDHSIRLTMLVRNADSTIVEAGAQMIRVPFRRCRATLNLTDRIAGLVIGRGINKRIADALGHNSGCMHLVELAMTAARMAAAVLVEAERGLAARDHFESLSEEEMIRLGMPYLKNTCLVFRVEE